MSSSDSYYGVAFTSLVTTDESLFKQTLKFYHALGFATVKDFDKFTNGENSLLAVGTSRDSLREVWLESFKLSEIDELGFRVPQQEARNKQQSEGALLKLRLVQQSKAAAQQTVARANLVVTYFSTELAQLQQRFPEAKLESSDASGVQFIRLVDPLGTRVEFTNFVHPADSKPTGKGFFESADENNAPAASSATPAAMQANIDQIGRAHV